MILNMRERIWPIVIFGLFTMAAPLFVTNITSAAPPPDSGSAIDQVNQSKVPP